MTVVGIAGCSALMLTGFGMYDSIRDIVGLQFGELYHYDLTTVLQEELSDRQREDIEACLFDNDAVAQSIYVHQESMEIKGSQRKKLRYLPVCAGGSGSAGFLYYAANQKRAQAVVSVCSKGWFLLRKRRFFSVLKRVTALQ